jgi:2-polyprenyl-6-methoxyphenol hydroxylase-like FAD-dependent oxidoreductase
VFNTQMCHGFRTYLIHRGVNRAHRFSGDRDAHSFIDACRATGGPDGWFEDAKQVGLLASFEAASNWVTHPARDGVALIGDAAGASDPAYGCGLSLTLRDVRVLRDHLRAESDWRRAADRYATDHDQYFDAMKRIIDWRTEMNHSTGPAADARRAHAGPLMRQDPTRAPDMHGLGPEAPSNDLARRRYFGEV